MVFNRVPLWLMLSWLLLLWPNLLLAKPALRIVSLAPHATEIAYAAGLGAQLVAVSDYSDCPAEARQLPKVANYQSINLEKIIALQPDLIIAWPAGNPAKPLEKLAQLGFNIYYSQTEQLEQIANNIEQLSQYASDPSPGIEAAKQFRTRLAQLKQRYRHAEPVRYFYQLSEQPIITLAQGKWPSEIFQFCGGVNVFASSAAPYPQVGIEQVLRQNPEVIFSASHLARQDSRWHDWPQQLQAVANQHIWSLNSDWLNRPTPRSLLAIEQVCKYFDLVRKNH
ncbi:vitamin B12 ABC transporter substrate-binding protein BtuF [Vibrio sp.]|uniref:vitamin B12 ABC transporter substrate-binding protein BtuF n=1 Tax=Vibrio sp. TaxID=678 RepID=UPI003D131016